MHEATATRDPPHQTHLSMAEIGAAFDALSDDDRLKLTAIEAQLLGATGLGRGDLLHEALCRALTGRRKCPRHVPFMAFLIETMKSLAFHYRERHRRSVALADSPGQSDDLNNPDSIPGPEDQLISDSVLEDIYNHFESDDEATLVLMGWADGLRGGDLREATGLDQSGLDYAIKRIRARMRKLYPNGWIS